MYTMVWSDLEIPNFVLLKRADNVLFSVQYGLKMRFFRKLIVTVVSSNEVRKMVLTISVALAIQKKLQ